MKFTYLSTARIPSEKANTYQVLQMCAAWTSLGVDLTLLYPQRSNPTRIQAAGDLAPTAGQIREHYGLKQSFPMAALETTDFILASTRVIKKPAQLSRFIESRAFQFMLSTYAKSASRYLRQNPPGVLYTRSLELVDRLDISSDLTRRTYFEAHSLPAEPVLPAAARLGGVVALTGRLKDRLQQAGIQPERILVSPDGVDLERFQGAPATSEEPRQILGLPQGVYLVGYVGRLHTLGTEKGAADLIHALAELKRSRPEIKAAVCFVGGPDEMAESYRLLAGTLGLAPEEVIFCPQAPPTQVPAYLAAFDVCAMPFPWTEHFAYNMSPLKLFEYMAAGRAILATELPTVTEILTHGLNAHLAPPGNPPALAKAIAFLYENPDYAQRLARRARQDVEAYTWEKRAKKILSFIQESL